MVDRIILGLPCSEDNVALAPNFNPHWKKWLRFYVYENGVSDRFAYMLS